MLRESVEPWIAIVTRRYACERRLNARKFVFMLTELFDQVPEAVDVEARPALTVGALASPALAVAVAALN